MMEHLEEFPFNIGQRVESKSNIKGFRGAWFRCEIKYVQIRKGEIWCAMQYVDFPDEKINFTKAYQQDPSGKKKRVLMLRPCFPLLCMGVDNAVINAAAGAVVVVNGDWWVGDLVDWFSDGCFWAAKITAVISKERVQVELPNAPIGEGGNYEALVKDIRPSLDWSMDQLWTVPSLKSHPNSKKQAVAVDQASSSLASPSTVFETGEKEHFFIARQEPVRTTVVKSSDNTLMGDEEAQMKRKAWVLGLEACSLPEKSKVLDVRYSNSSNRISKHTNVANQGMPFTVSAPPPLRAGKDSAAVDFITKSTGPFDSVSDMRLARQRSLPDAFGIGSYSSFSSVFSLHNKPVDKKDQLEMMATDFAGEHVPGVSFHQPEGGFKEEANQTGCLKAGGYKELHQSMSQVNDSETRGGASSERRTYGRGGSLSISNQTAEAMSLEDIDALIGGEGKCLDVGDQRIGSSIMALEELVSRVAWLRGVLQLGLKGWCQERKKKNWVFCEREASPVGKSEQDVKLDQNSASLGGPGSCPAQAWGGESCVREINDFT